MFKQIEGMPPDVLAVEAVGEVSHGDYRDWLIPKAEAMFGHGPVRMLYVIGPGFTGFDLQALADDAGFGLKHMHDFTQIAVVSDHVGLNGVIAMFKPFFHGEVRVFRMGELDMAKTWIKAGPRHE